MALNKSFHIRVAQYDIKGVPNLPFIGNPTHFALQLTNKRGQVIDEINFGASRRGGVVVRQMGMPWHDNQLIFERGILDRDAVNHPVSRAYTEVMARALFEAICDFGEDLIDADIHYFFTGYHPLKKYSANSNSAIGGALMILGIDPLDIDPGHKQAPIGMTKDIFLVAGKALGSQAYYRQRAAKHAKQLYHQIKTRAPDLTEAVDSAFADWQFWLYRFRSQWRRFWHRFYVWLIRSVRRSKSSSSLHTEPAQLRDES